jgi:hypothetical protein
MRAGALIAFASVLLLGHPPTVLGQDLAEIERLQREVQVAGEELLAAAEAGGLEPRILDALRGLLAGLDRDDRAFLEAYWEGRSRYTEWTEKVIWADEIRGNLEKQLEVVLPSDERLDQALRAYAQARLPALEGAMGPGGCHFHLWAQLESAGDPETASGRRVQIGHHSPLCRNLAPPIALRSVRWHHASEEPRPWRGPLPGISVALDDESIEVTAASAIAHTLDSVPATDVEFERGFLRPGDSLELFLWNAPPADDRYLLEIELVVVDPSELDGPVLLPERRTESVTVYRRGERALDRDLAGLAFVPWKKSASPEMIRLVRPLGPPQHAQ